MTESTVNQIGAAVVAAIAIIPATLAAVWSHKSKSNTNEALHEVKENGGMADPDPTLKDYIRYVGENTILLGKRLEKFEEKFDKYIEAVEERLDNMQDKN